MNRLRYKLDWLYERMPVGTIPAVLTVAPQTVTTMTISQPELFRVKAEFPGRPDLAGVCSEFGPYIDVRLAGEQLNELIINFDRPPFAEMFKGIFEELIEHHRGELDRMRENMAQSRHMTLEPIPKC